MSTPRKEIGYCPECDARVRLKSPRVGQKVTCHNCDTELEIVDTSPLELDWAFEEGLDFDHVDYDNEKWSYDYDE